MPQKMNNSDKYSAEFLDINLEAINELATFAQIYQGFTLAFAEVNFALDVQVLLKTLKNHPRCQNVQFIVIEITDPELEFVLSELKNGLQKAALEPDKKIVIVVLGLERAIGFVETKKTPEVLENLNFARNVFTEQLPYPVIFVLPDYALTRLARGARDFWAWASAVIAFRAGRQTIEYAQQQVLEPKRLFDSNTKPVKQERIDTLLRLLTQYQPTLGKPSAEVEPLRLNILDELANAYWSLAEVQKAKHFFTEALSLAQKIDNKWAQANAVLGLGRILVLSGNYDNAIEHYDQALVLYKSLDNRLGEAHTLIAIGDALHQFLKRSQEALNRYEEAIQLFIAVGDSLGEANALKAVGDVLPFLKTQAGNDDVMRSLRFQDSTNKEDYIFIPMPLLDQRYEALNRYDEALKLYKVVGDRLGEANTLIAIGDVLQFFNQRQEALNRYDEALRLYKIVGDRLGEANTLKAIGDVFQLFDQRYEALNRYNTALKLYKDVGDYLGEANTLQAIGDVLLRQENVDEAIFQQGITHIETAYNLYCDIGDRYSQARILLTSIAPLRFRLGQREQAIAAITKAAELAAEIGYEPMQQHAADMLKTLQQQEA